MPKIEKIKAATGLYWVTVPEAGLHVMCGSPADSVKHLMKRGLITNAEKNGVVYETGPNAILLSDVSVQNECFSNLAEFPVLQMLYRQGLMIPGHPNNTGMKPMIIGSQKQVTSQLQYIYRGNYGLVTEEEIRHASIDAATAAEMMRMKMKFAFGKIEKTEEFLDYKIIGAEPVEVLGGVRVKRLRLNIFEFTFEDESVTVDMNLGPNEYYEAPYPLGYQDIEREYFAVVHSGEGDGWNTRHPCMASIIMYQGKIFLIDAGPNIQHSLSALGIGINEIEGIFQTHAHDDHFAGLTTLIRSGKKIKYYASPLVRSSVTKKLSALTSIREIDFSSYFEIHDLKMNKWNDLMGLEVRPMFSPHPVETTIFVFRSMAEKGYRTYAHFADITSFDVLEGMVTENIHEPGITRQYCERIKKRYLTRWDIKKVDVGGGMIHGNAIDFRDDRSGKVILSHKSAELNVREKEIGSGAPFGMKDILISSHLDYLRAHAVRLLERLFPMLSTYHINILVNNRIQTFNPQTILIKRGETNNSIYLVLTGSVEIIQSELGICNTLSAGGFVGAGSGLSREPSKETYRAVNFVHALELPCRLATYIVKKNAIFTEIIKLLKRHEFLQNSWLLGEEIPFYTQVKIIQGISKTRFSADHQIPSGTGAQLLLLREGKVDLVHREDLFETLSPGSFIGEGGILFGKEELFNAVAREDSSFYLIPAEEIIEIPIVRCKLYETYDRRIAMVMGAELMKSRLFEWKRRYATGIESIDQDHRRLFGIAESFCVNGFRGEDVRTLSGQLELLLNETREHFEREEELMSEMGYPDLEPHRRFHESLITEARRLEKDLMQGEIHVNRYFAGFLRQWLRNHMLREDLKIGRFARNAGKKG